MHVLDAIGSLDGRYRDKMEVLSKYFSEAALFRARVRMEVEYLLALSDNLNTSWGLDFSGSERRTLKKLYQGFSTNDAETVKAIETAGYQDIPATNHDVKAVEIYMRLKLEKTSLKDCLEAIHFGLTSEDVNNIAYALILSDALQAVIIPQLLQVHDAIKALAKTNAGVAMLARTHGQAATPTTLGKEMNVFATRLMRQIKQLQNFRILAKLNGASGNHCAHVAVFPKTNWIKFTEQFIQRLNYGRKVRLEANLVTTQIEPHDTYAELFGILGRANTILIDFCQDIWRYISDYWLAQKAVAGEVGSSAMPHKVNPIKMENAEGNLGMANAMFEFFNRKLPVSRLQRDLSDSTVERNFGLAFGFSSLAYQSIVAGMSKLSPNPTMIAKALAEHPEVITEAIQNILRREGINAAYNKLKDFSRGRTLTMESIRKFIESLEGLKPQVVEELLALTPETYTGLATTLAKI